MSGVATRIVVLSIGGALGVNARYWLDAWMGRWNLPRFPWSTIAINVSGSFAIGVLAVLLARWLPHPNVRLFALVGFLGGYTTFSTFSLDSLVLLERRQPVLALLNMAGSVVAGLAAVALGAALARGLVEWTSTRGGEATRTGVGPSGPERPQADPGPGV